MLRAGKAKTARTKRFMDNRAPKIVENTKTAVILKGGNSSETVTTALKDMHKLKKPQSIHLLRKNPMLPFEDDTSIEFLSKKNDASLFLFGSHNKKRPNNLVFGRLYDFHVLDMMEMGIENFKPLADFKDVAKPASGSKPCLVFNGDLFDTHPDFIHTKNLMIDFFRGPILTQVSLKGLDHVISFTASETGVLYLRTYMIELRKSGTRVPRVELQECGPSMDLSLRRTRYGQDDVRKQACRVPTQSKPKKVKNISHDTMHNTVGRIHMEKQDLDNLQIRKVKALKKRKIIDDGTPDADE